MTLTITGTNFLAGSVARWDGAGLATTVNSASQLTATIPASFLTAVGTYEITVLNPGVASTPYPFFVTATVAPITAVDSGTSTDPSGTATSSVGGGGSGTSGSISAEANGSGTVTVAQYAANPVAPPPAGGTGTYTDVYIAAGSNFSSLTIVNCNLNGGTVAYWWNGTTWALASPQSYSAATGCITITVTASSSPSLAQLTGTYFAAAQASASPSPSASPSATPSPTASPSPSPSGPTLTVVPVPAAQGSVTVTRAGARATLRANPAAGQIFLGWKLGGAPVSTWVNPLTLDLTADTTVAATFAARPVFNDAGPGETGASEAIAQLAARGIIRGCDPDAGLFCPANTTLRAQMAVLIVRTMGWGGENAATRFSDRNGVDDELWRAIGILEAHGVARGYGDGTFGTTGDVLNAQVISFITRAMVNKGYWQFQPDNGTIYPNVGAGTGHRQDLVTFVHYAGGIRGAENTSADFSGWDQPASRAWFAFALWQALDSKFGR